MELISSPYSLYSSPKACRILVLVLVLANIHYTLRQKPTDDDICNGIGKFEYFSLPKACRWWYCYWISDCTLCHKPAKMTVLTFKRKLKTLTVAVMMATMTRTVMSVRMMMMLTICTCHSVLLLYPLQPLQSADLHEKQNQSSAFSSRLIFFSN